MEASALPAPAGLARPRVSIGASLLRLRTDEQLVSLFRAGNDEAFRVIHDRYRQRLFAYTRQMFPGSRQDAEDALQDIFVRAYSSLRANDRELALRAWLYRVAHNRCIDELRRPAPPLPEVMEFMRAPAQDPVAKAEQREELKRLIADVQRLPDQQRSALLMRELGGMTYADMAGALGVSLPAIKSLLVRARVGLAQALEARDTACSQIREELILSHDRGVRPTGMARRHMRDCAGCREFRSEVRGLSRQFAALAPALGPFGLLANLLGIGGGGSAAASAGGGAAAAGGAASTSGAVASAGIFATGATHVVTLLAAAVVTAGGAVEIQRTVIAPAPAPRAHHHHVVARTSEAATPSYTAPSPTPEATSASASQSLTAAPDPPPATTKTRRAPTGSPPASTAPGADTPAASSTSAGGTDPAGTDTTSPSPSDPGTPGSDTGTNPVAATGTGASTPSGGTPTGVAGGVTGGTTSATGSSSPGSSTPTSSGGSTGTSTPSTPATVSTPVSFTSGTTDASSTGPTSRTSGTGMGS